MVVLAVRQATHGQRLRAALIGPSDSLSCLAHLLVGKAGQVVDPAQQHGFFVTVRLDSLAAGVFHSLRRLPQQQRSLGVPPIDQIHERKSERRDLVTDPRRIRGIRAVSRMPRHCRCGTVRTERRAARGYTLSTKNDSSTGRVACADALSKNALANAAITKAENSAGTGDRPTINFLPPVTGTVSNREQEHWHRP